MTAITHGYSAYGNGKCRCQVCCAAFAEYCRWRRARYRQAGIPPHVEHGTHNAYVNYMCRCESCRAAASTYNRRYRAARKAGAA